MRDVPAIIPELTACFRWAEPQLVAACHGSDPKQRLHASLALLRTDASQIEFLRQRLLDAGPEEVGLICRVLAPFAKGRIEQFWGLVEGFDTRQQGPIPGGLCAAAWAAGG